MLRPSDVPVSMCSEESRSSNIQMRLLLIGSGEPEFIHLRELLLRAGDGSLELEHVASAEDALQRMLDSNYDLLLCEYKPADGEALHLLHDLRESCLQTPVIFLSDHIDQVTVAAAINAGAYDLV
jgi:DNA-binding NarL/FixJ family response regulator